jgi:hypothetical protein
MQWMGMGAYEPMLALLNEKTASENVWDGEWKKPLREVRYRVENLTRDQKPARYQYGMRRETVYGIPDMYAELYVCITKLVGPADRS